MFVNITFKSNLSLLLSTPGGIFGTLASSDSGVRTFHCDSQYKVRTPESGPARVPEMSPGTVYKI